MIARLAAVLVFAASVVLAVSGDAAATVKLSRSGICHDTASPWYERTRNFTPHRDMASCLREGRSWRRSSGGAAAPALVAPGSDARGVAYDRALYGDWIDADGDCRDTRQEMLEALATGPVTWRGCRAIHGRWNDPYSGRILTDPSGIDIDHLVPLAWAHARGGAGWTAETRRRFANDPVNLFAVEARLNRAKGADGPLDWLPPNAAFRCEYVTRFARVVRLYDIRPSPREAQAMERQRRELCGR